MYKQILTTSDVAKCCGVHHKTVIRWIDKGELLGFQLPGRGDYRIPYDAFTEFLDRNGMKVDLSVFEEEESVLRALVVDDDIPLGKAIAKVFMNEGFVVTTCDSGFYGGACASVQRPKVISLDLSMPGMNGFQVIECVRNMKPTKDAKIVVISGLPEEDLGDALNAGADAVLKKPFKREELVTVIRGFFPNLQKKVA